MARYLILYCIRSSAAARASARSLSSQRPTKQPLRIADSVFQCMGFQYFDEAKIH